MPSWNELLNEIDQLEEDPGASLEWFKRQVSTTLTAVSQLRGDRNVLFYASAFLQKPQAPGHWLAITSEDVNAFMSCIYGMDWKKGLTLILHTPGGEIAATETLVAYLHSKFSDIEVIVPTYAMSAGTMVSLAAHRVVMGRQSQLGPIDPQMPLGRAGGLVSARSVKDQFERAKTEVMGDTRLAHVWAPILQSLGPAVLQEALDALAYGEDMVCAWLQKRMFSGDPDAATKARETASYFSDKGTHKSHGRRIDRDEARKHGLTVEDLESDQRLQEAVLTAYHVVTIVFEKTPSSKALLSHHGKRWVKAWEPGN